jgi:hypothetical protein
MSLEYPIRDLYSFASGSTTSPFTITVNSNSRDLPAVGTKLIAFIKEDADNNVFAIVNGEITGATVLTVNSVVGSSESDGSLPTFSAPVTITSCGPTEAFNNMLASGFDVFIGAGQSNMVGDEVSGFSEIDNSDPEVYALGFDSNDLTTYNKIVQSRFGADFPQTITSDPCGGIINNFCKRYRFSNSGYKRPVLYVPSARGDTGFTNNFWNPGNLLSDITINAINTVLTLSPDSTVRGMIWMQGERDAMDAATELDYTNNLIAFWNNLKSNINVSVGTTADDISKMRLVVCGMQTGWVSGDISRQPVADAHTNIGANITYSAYASGAAYTGAVGGVHYLTAELNSFGYNEVFDAWNAAGLNV